MVVRRSFALLISLALMTQAASCSKRENSLPPPRAVQGLVLTLQTDKQSYKAGDAITVTCVLTNVGSADIALLQWGWERETDWMRAMDSRGNYAESVLIGILDAVPRRKIKPEDFTVLKAGGSYRRVYVGRITAPKRDFFIAFDYSALLLKRFGDCWLWAEYSVSLEWTNKLAATFPPTKVFDGCVTSEAVRISVEK